MIGIALRALEFLAFALAVYFAFAAARHAVFSLVALVVRHSGARPHEPRTRFTVLIPAHNEEAGVGRTISAAREIDYPAHMFEIVVLADNCDDGTADVARRAGVNVVERRDPRKRGKGFALDWFISGRTWGEGDALVCLDADSVVDADYLRALDAAIQDGAPAVQGYNGARDPGRSSLAALSTLTNTMKNAGTYAGRARLGLPAPLMNGWCLTGRVLRNCGWMSFSVAEDFEQTLRLAILGVYPRFVDSVAVRSEKASSFAKAAGQRKRWSGGQAQVAKTLGRYARRKAIRERSWSLWELTMDVVLPGYAINAAALIALALGACRFVLPWVWLASCVGLLMIAVATFVGVVKTRPRSAVIRGLALAPFFVVWKVLLAISARIRPPKTWHRADRDD
ncbi:MAG: glycosyltransferase family 2 protein [Deltaproteobacteria bacterium]|nr:glycosyltransferase family 2 protein [Deltaproteobacteria bacterium]